MEKIALITDSSCDLEMDEINKHNIKLLPFRIIYKDREFRDRIDISPEYLYANIEKEVPTTSLPSIETTDEILTSLEREGYTHVIIITISLGFSGTYNSVKLIAEDHPNLKFHIFDTKTLSREQGYIVLDAARMIEAGESFDNIVKALPGCKDRTGIFFTLDTLEYLRKGGRIGRVAGVIGQLLNIKPVITVAPDGNFSVHSKVRGRKQSLKVIREILDEWLSNGKCKVAVLHGGASEEAKKFYDEIKDLPNITSLGFSAIGPALGVHTGPGLVGITLEKE
ncbi:DegV family protein [Clostridium paridis]|uniref:DegV family protein n=1 Tax=Clostridium paridis TaxID=2803863 RepID=A0A937FHC9_9CLOT|nr:DegV family protein [Clostridium paridis]MBL4931446.1 DegV family protein [Clostridium paridis]